MRVIYKCPLSKALVAKEIDVDRVPAMLVIEECEACVNRHEILRDDLVLED